MKTLRALTAPALAALALALALAAPGPAGAAEASAAEVGAAPRSYPPEQQRRYQLVVQKCSRCHSMDVSLNQRYSAAEWKASLRRMVRLNGAGISPEQAQEIGEFLRFYAVQSQRR
jgi:cytochrome c5